MRKTPARFPDGSRAEQAAEKLEKSGSAERHLMEGGTMNWPEALGEEVATPANNHLKR